MVCGACGTENGAGRKFCGECGSPLAAACAICGATNAAGVKFCGECGATLAAQPQPITAASPPQAERRLVSVLFADLVGFTSASESRDAEDTRELLSRYFDTCRRLIELYGGTVEKFIGDAVMAVWGTPTATEEIYADLGVPFLLAVTHLEHAEWLVAQGRSEEAEPLLAETRDTFERLAAKPWLERVVALAPSTAEVPA